MESSVFAHTCTEEAVSAAVRLRYTLFTQETKSLFRRHVVYVADTIHFYELNCEMCHHGLYLVSREEG